jgi:predicted dehydrogenase
LNKVGCGIVGFGFIGPHHAEAMRRIPAAELVAVASMSEAGREKARRLGVPRVYESHEELIADPDVGLVDVATPTRYHHPVATAAIRAGKHVVVDKPLAVSRGQAEEMLEAATAAGVVHGITFNYRYNAVVQHARAMLRRGDLGELRIVRGHYLQEWLLYDTDYSWRLDPDESGEAAMVADAGCHWFDLVEYVSGARVESVLADLTTLIPVRRRPAGGAVEAFSSAGTTEREDYTVRVPDCGTVLLRFSNGARGTFLTSPLCAGHKNDLRVEFCGSRASLEWGEEQSHQLWIGRRDEPNQILMKDPSLLDASALPYAALPGGHNEAWPDAFRNTLGAIIEHAASGATMRPDVPFPTFAAGVRAAVIADALVASYRAGGVWTRVD